MGGSSKTIITLGAATLVAGVLTVLLFGGDDEEAVFEASIGFEDVEPAPPPRRAIRPPWSEEPPAIEIPAATGDEGGSGRTLELKGRVIVVDTDGMERDTESGSFELSTSIRGGTFRAVEVAGGTFEVELSAPRTLRFGAFRLGERRAVLESVPQHLPAGGYLELRVRWPQTTTLNVLDAELGHALSGIEVVARKSYGSDGLSHPGGYEADEVITKDGASPMELVPDRYRRAYFVRAHGYAWGRVQLRADAGGEQTVELRSAATVEVTITNPSAAPGDAILRISPVPDRPLDRRPAPAAELPLGSAPRRTIEGLAPGPVAVSVEVGPWHANPVILALGQAVLEGGRYASLELTLDVGGVRKETVPLSGAIRVPAALRNEPFAIDIQPVPSSPLQPRVRITTARMRQDAEDPGRLWFDAGDVRPGYYVVSILGTFFEIAVGPEGEHGIELQLPVPTEVIVRILDEGTGEPIHPAFVMCNSEAPSDVTVVAGARGRRDRVTGAYVFLLPPGPTDFKVRADTYLPQARKVVVGPSPEEVTFHLRRRQGIKIVLKDGGAVVPLPLSTKIEIKAIDHSRGAAGGAAHDGMTVTRYVPSFGRYEVKIAAVEGYDGIPPQLVQVEPGQVAELVVQVYRR